MAEENREKRERRGKARTDREGKRDTQNAERRWRERKQTETDGRGMVRGGGNREEWRGNDEHIFDPCNVQH